jgi:hypothetical protein
MSSRRPIYLDPTDGLREMSPVDSLDTLQYMRYRDPCTLRVSDSSKVHITTRRQIEAIDLYLESPPTGCALTLDVRINNEVHSLLSTDIQVPIGCGHVHVSDITHATMSQDGAPIMLQDLSSHLIEIGTNLSVHITQIGSVYPGKDLYMKIYYREI